MEYWSVGVLIPKTITPSFHHSITPLHSCFLHITDKRFPLVNRHVGIAHQRRQLVDHVPFGESFPTPMPGHADVMNQLAVEREGTNAPRHQRLGPDACPRRGDPAPVEVSNAFFGGELRTDFDEEFWLQ